MAYHRFIEALPDDLRPVFERELKRLLRDAYPESPAGTVLPFRRVFVLPLVTELSYEEIAETVHLPVGPVKSRLARARRMLGA